jgi:aspartyl aminopeptidase
MAHGLHPNYSGKHDPDHAPRLGQGLVIKTNANQRYATNAVSATLLRELALMTGENVQEFTGTLQRLRWPRRTDKYMDSPDWDE